MLEELGRDYVRTLHAKGLPNRRILWLHVLRNALPPIIALAGVMLRTLLGYTLIVETIFRWPGLGYQLVNAVLKRDYTVAQTLAILLTAAVILFNLLADLGQQWADPRVRQRARASMSAGDVRPRRRSTSTPSRPCSRAPAAPGATGSPRSGRTSWRSSAAS